MIDTVQFIVYEKFFLYVFSVINLYRLAALAIIFGRYE